MAIRFMFFILFYVYFHVIFSYEIFLKLKAQTLARHSSDKNKIMILLGTCPSLAIYYLNVKLSLYSY